MLWGERGGGERREERGGRREEGGERREKRGGRREEGGGRKVKRSEKEREREKWEKVEELE